MQGNTFEKSNLKANYCIKYVSRNELNIEKTRSERELGLIEGYDLKWSGHVDRMVRKSNRILDMLKRMFESKDPELWKDLYVSLIRPHLE